MAWAEDGMDRPMGRGVRDGDAACAQQLPHYPRGEPALRPGPVPAASAARTARIRRRGRRVPHPRIMSGRPGPAITTPPPPSDGHPHVAEAPSAPPRAHMPGGPAYETRDVSR